MKLLVKTGVYYLLMSIPILLLSGLFCYHMITYEVKVSNDELLSNRMQLVAGYLAKKDTVVLNLITRSGEAEIKKLASADKVGNVFSDTLIYDKNERELAPQRMLVSVSKIGDTAYRIKIWRSTLEYNELFSGIVLSLAIALFFLFLVSMLINVWISKTLWRPFYRTVSNVRSFRVTDHQPPAFLGTSVQEFSQLNDSISDMMQKMIADFNSQKKFTENASHEIQTPLAVIKTKIDLLIQSSNLGESEANLIMSIDEACTKLARLNQSLLLLTKIGNRQFTPLEKVSFREIVETSLSLFSGRLEEGPSAMALDMTDDFTPCINKDLCLVLVNNLLQNAIRHTNGAGKIEISLDSHSFTISNPGNNPLPASIFERFYKNSNSSEAMGLGLAIAKEIAEVSNMMLSYSFLADRHIFILSQAA